MLKSLFSKWFGKKEEVTPPLNPSPLIVDILTWIRSLESCKVSTKKHKREHEKGCKRVTNISYMIADDKRGIVIQKTVYDNEYDTYRDVFGYHCDLISKGYDSYTLVEAVSKQDGKIITLPLEELFEFYLKALPIISAAFFTLSSLSLSSSNFFLYSSDVG